MDTGEADAGPREPTPRPFAESGVGARVTHDVVEPANVYVSERDETVVTWQGPGMDPYVAGFDHATGEWSSHYRVGTNPLDRDTHGAPAIAVGPDDRYHVVFGTHGTDIQHARSTAPLEYTDWTRATITDGAAATYTHTYAVNDGRDLCILYRDGPTNHDGRLRLVRSTDGGASWGDPTTVVDGGAASPRPYGTAYDREADALHVTWGLNGRDGVFDVYHAVVGASGDRVCAAGGTDLGVPVTRAAASEHCLLRATDVVWHTRSGVRLDGAGHPHVVFGAPVGGTLSWQYVRWNGSTWTDPETVMSGVDETEGFDFRVRGDGDVEAFLSAGLGDLERWVRDAGGWRRAGTVVRNGDAYRTRKGWNPRIVPGRDGFVTFSESDPEGDGLRVWAYEDGQFR